MLYSGFSIFLAPSLGRLALFAAGITWTLSACTSSLQFTPQLILQRAIQSLNIFVTSFYYWAHSWCSFARTNKFRNSNQYLFSDPTMEFESDISPLQPFLDQMDAPPTEELLDYLENWIPKTDHEFYTGRFDNIRTMEQNSVDCAPDYTVIPLGFFSIADEGEGWKYTYCVHDRCVYLLGYLSPGEVNSVADVRSKAQERWPSLNAFLLAVEQGKLDN